MSSASVKPALRTCYTYVGSRLKPAAVARVRGLSQQTAAGRGHAAPQHPTVIGPGPGLPGRPAGVFSLRSAFARSQEPVVGPASHAPRARPAAPSYPRPHWPRCRTPFRMGSGAPGLARPGSLTFKVALSRLKYQTCRPVSSRIPRGGDAPLPGALLGRGPWGRAQRAPFPAPPTADSWPPRPAPPSASRNEKCPWRTFNWMKYSAAQFHLIA